MYHGPVVQTDLVPRAAKTATLLGVTLTAVHLLVAAAALLAFALAMATLARGLRRRRTTWR